MRGRSLPSQSTVPAPTLKVHLDWPYDAALAQMRAARDAVVAAAHPGTVFVGSHREEVVTLGRHAPESQLIARGALDARGVLVRRIERGGGATAHGPGQLVVYPVIPLSRFGLDVPGLTRALLAAAVDLARDNGVDAEACLEARGAGVYTRDGCKLASVGFRVERGVVTHGLAINVANDLSLFELIAPCGVSSARMAALGDSKSLIDQADRLALHVGRRCVLGWAVTRLTSEFKASGGMVSGSGTGADA